MQKGQASIEFLILVGAVILATTFVVATLINIAVPLEEQVEEDAIDLLCSSVVQLDQCNGRQVKIRGQSFNCILANSKCLWENSSLIPKVEVTAVFAEGTGCRPNAPREIIPFMTVTDRSGLGDFGGVLHFTVAPAIPAGSLINSATLEMYMNSQAGTCTNTDPHYFYDSPLSAPSSLVCNSGNRSDSGQPWYNAVPDNGPPPGELASDNPTPQDCVTGQYKSFEIKGAIVPDGGTEYYIEVRGEDVGAGFIYRQWDYTANFPTLEINYTPP